MPTAVCNIDVINNYSNYFEVVKRDMTKELLSFLNSDKPCIL